MSLGEQLVIMGLVPDSLIRKRIVALLEDRISEEIENYKDPNRLSDLLQMMHNSPVALHTSDANAQHYEVPTRFFQLVLGKHLKYSSGHWQSDTTLLDQAEESALEITCTRAEIANGMQILELGCGWGSLSLFMAARFPQATIVSVSNSKTQKAFIDNVCKERGIKNLQIITADMNDFTIDRKFDRVVSVEMFEHMRNWKMMFGKIHSWLKPDGKFFMHIFTHSRFTYFYEIRNDDDWMAKYFFTGGMMPGDNLPMQFSELFTVAGHWTWNGTNYGKTARAWLNNMDRNKKVIMQLFENTYGKDCKKWWHYWRMFFMACEELWNYNQGNEWLVSHYVLEKTHAQ